MRWSRSLFVFCSWSLFPATLAAQGAPTAPVADLTFPTFANGDGRQKLSDFRGHAILVATFADVWGGMAASDPAVKLWREHEDAGLIVILMHLASGGTYEDAATKLDLGAWAMRRYPGSGVRLCKDFDPTWRWTGAMSPFFAVLGPDLSVVATGDVQKGARPMQEAVAAALQRCNKGWGAAEEAPVRALAYGKGALGQARSTAPASLVPELDALFARHVAVVEWLIADGQWQRAKAQSARLESAVKGFDEWSSRAATLTASFATDSAKAELDLDGKLARLLDPLNKGAPEKALHKRLADFAKKNDGSSVGGRAARIATLVEQALTAK